MKLQFCKITLLIIICLLTLSLPELAVGQNNEDFLSNCETEVLGGQQILTCIPDNFNGYVVLYAHGYVSPQNDLELPIGELETFIPVIANIFNLGAVFATTSFSVNGYAFEQAEKDLNALVQHIAEDKVPPGSIRKVLLTGASEGGGITVMMVEKHPDIYAGGLALCGPVGGMPIELRYLGDFRQVFDYYFPGVIPLSGIYRDDDEDPVDATEWRDDIISNIEAAINNNLDVAQQLFKVTGVCPDPENPAGSAVNLLHYSVLGMDDFVTKSGGGHPYGNLLRIYSGSQDDAALNAGVERVASDFTGRRYIRRFYNTTGNLQNPVVTLHTTCDDAVPYLNEVIYKFKVAARGKSHNLLSLPVFRSGHCNFTADEVLVAFTLLVLLTL